jgi:hypothetical protein
VSRRSSKKLSNVRLRYFSVRQKIRDGDPDFMVTASSWPIFLYAKYQSDPNNIEKGLFRSTLLLKVRFSISIIQYDITLLKTPIIIQTFKAIFTSPSSAQSVQASDRTSSKMAQEISNSSARAIVDRNDCCHWTFNSIRCCSGI